MKRLITLVALSAISISVLFSADSASAKSDTTNKKPKQQTTIVTVKAGETLTSIAEKHHTTYVRLFNANKDIANPDLIDVGDRIRIPTTAEKLEDRFSAITAAASTPQSYSGIAYAGGYSATPSAQTSYTVGSVAGNTYYQGYCTWYAKNRRPDLPNMLGNGGEWTANAAARGYSTGSTARAGAIAETPGHVMYVEKVYGDGTMLISEMNGSAGFGNVGTRRVSTSGHQYIY